MAAAAGTKVAVIGGGPLGLMALKTFVEDGFDATLFERRNWVGGIWKYSDDSGLSVAENTVFNSSKYRTAMSDFPVPEEMDDFPTAPQLLKYLESYCEHFDLWPRIQLNSPVGAVKRSGERWAVEVGGGAAGEVRTEYFDKVAFSCGPFIKPRKPDLEGAELFEGTSLHAIEFHNPAQFKGQNVVVLGVHASAQDVVSSLSKYASKAYLSHRSGVVMLSRYSKDGSVFDRMPPLNFTLFTAYLESWCPSLFNWSMNKLVGMIAKDAFPDRPASLGSIATTPAPSVAVASPLIASQIYPHFRSGFCEGVPAIARILGPKSIELSSGRILTDIDAIIYCTGYYSGVPVPIEPAELNPYPYPGALPSLYRNIFPLHPDPAIRTSLAFLGQGAIPSPGFSPPEAVSMCVSQIWLGNSVLPSLSQMQKWRRNYLRWREGMVRRYDAKSTFYTFFVPMADHMTWVDETAGLGIREHFGFGSRWTSARAWRFWWNEKELYDLCLTGMTSPAMLRLFEMGKRKGWEGARRQIVVDNERVKRAQERRSKEMKKQV